MMGRVVSVVLCEGFLDRAFLAGLLGEVRGWSDPGMPTQVGHGRRPAFDPWDEVKKVEGGTYRYDAPGGRASSILLVPCRGKSGVRPTAKLFLQQRATRPLGLLVLCRDADIYEGANWDEAHRRDADSLANLVEPFDPRAIGASQGEQHLADGSLVASVLWGSTDPAASDVPAQQCLERLVCAAIRDEYPARSAAVQSWLSGRPSPPADEPPHKAMAWCHMAGWFAENGCEDFYRAVWRDARLAQNLAGRLDRLGVIRLLEAMETATGA